MKSAISRNNSVRRATAKWQSVVGMERVGTLIGRMRRSLTGLRKDTRGTVGILFGLSIIPVGGLVGAALDYNRALEFRTFMRSEADSAALNIASADIPNTDAVIAALKTRLANRFGGNPNTVSDVSASGSWQGGGADYTLTISAKLSMMIVSIMPGAPKQVPISVTTVVRRKPPIYEWSLPSIKDLSYEADDYNRLSVYCYNDAKKTDANMGRRMETLTAISDNGGTDYSSAKLPSCKEGETLSYKLWNVRSSRTTPSRWQKTASGDPETNYSLRTSGVDYYTYFTDTTMDPSTRVQTQNITGGKETYNKNKDKYSISSIDVSGSQPILETILCTTNVDCKPKSQGGILPNNHETGRTPATATAGCSEGKSMYFGWEDRPPSGGSDKDYDDIRIIVSCPTLIKVADKEVRIIK